MVSASEGEHPRVTRSHTMKLFTSFLPLLAALAFATPAQAAPQTNVPMLGGQGSSPAYQRQVELHRARLQRLQQMTAPAAQQQAHTSN